jgi:hypothetical protein
MRDPSAVGQVEGSERAWAYRVLRRYPAGASLG